MIKFIIDEAEKVQVGDVIIGVVGNEEWPRDCYYIGEVREITSPHPDLIGFMVKILAHLDGEKGIKEMVSRPYRKVGIIRRINNAID